MSSNPQITIGVSAVDKASEILSGVDSAVDETARHVEESGNKTISVFSRMRDRFNENKGEFIRGTAELGASVVAFGASFSELEDSQYRAERSNLSLQTAQNRLEKLQKSGKASAEDIARAQDAVALAQEHARLENDHMHESFNRFLAEVPLQMIGFAQSGISLFNMLKTTQVASAASAVESAVSYDGALASMSASNEEASTTMNAFRVASIEAFITNPVGIAIIGITTLVALLYFNVGGLRDRFVEIGKVIYDFITSKLGPLSDLIKYIASAFGSLAGNTQDQTQATTELASSTDNLNQKVTVTIDKIQTYQDYLDKLDQSTSKNIQDNYYYIASHNQVAASLVTTGDQINLVAGYLHQQESDTQRVTQENFNLVASHYSLHQALSMTQEQLASTAKKIQEQEQALKQHTSTVKDFGNTWSNAWQTASTAATTHAAKINASIQSIQDKAIQAAKAVANMGGNITPEMVTAAGLGGNSAIMQSAKAGRLGGVWQGNTRVLDSGGQLFEDVIGIGKDTGTPHLLHKNELVVPPNKLSGFSSQPKIEIPVTVNITDNGNSNYDVAVQVGNARKRIMRTNIQRPLRVSGL